jgi:hypothetical protein
MRRLLLPIFLLTLKAADTPDLKKTPTLYVVGYAHLDTEWNWDYVTTIGQYLPRTMHDNFDLFEKYPHYVFNFQLHGRQSVPDDEGVLSARLQEGENVCR